MTVPAPPNTAESPLPFQLSDEELGDHAQDVVRIVEGVHNTYGSGLSIDTPIPTLSEFDGYVAVGANLVTDPDASGRRGTLWVHHDDHPGSWQFDDANLVPVATVRKVTDAHYWWEAYSQNGGDAVDDALAVVAGQGGDIDTAMRAVDQDAQPEVWAALRGWHQRVDAYLADPDHRGQDRRTVERRLLSQVRDIQQLADQLNDRVAGAGSPSPSTGSDGGSKEKLQGSSLIKTWVGRAALAVVPAVHRVLRSYMLEGVTQGDMRAAVTGWAQAEKGAISHFEDDAGYEGTSNPVPDPDQRVVNIHGGLSAVEEAAIETRRAALEGPLTARELVAWLTVGGLIRLPEGAYGKLNKVDLLKLNPSAWITWGAHGAYHIAGKGLGLAGRAAVYTGKEFKEGSGLKRGAIALFALGAVAAVAGGVTLIFGHAGGAVEAAGAAPSTGGAGSAARDAAASHGGLSGGIHGGLGEHVASTSDVDPTTSVAPTSSAAPTSSVAPTPKPTALPDHPPVARGAGPSPNPADAHPGAPGGAAPDTITIRGEGDNLTHALHDRGFTHQQTDDIIAKMRADGIDVDHVNPGQTLNLPDGTPVPGAGAPAPQGGAVHYDAIGNFDPSQHTGTRSDSASDYLHSLGINPTPEELRHLLNDPSGMLAFDHAQKVAQGLPVYPDNALPPSYQPDWPPRELIDQMYRQIQEAIRNGN